MRLVWTLAALSWGALAAGCGGSGDDIAGPAAGGSASGSGGDSWGGSAGSGATAGSSGAAGAAGAGAGGVGCFDVAAQDAYSVSNGAARDFDFTPPVVVPLAGEFRNYRPHYGATAEGHASCSYYYSDVNGSWPYSVSWGSGCHQTRYFYLDASVTSQTGWAEAAVEAFKNWDIPDACTPHWVRTTSAASADVTIKRSNISNCAAPGVSWYACAWSGWSITLNTAIGMGVGVPGKIDVESLITVELAHVVHFAHSPNFADSVSQANTASWGASSMSMNSANSCNFVKHTVCVPSGSCTYKDCAPLSQGGCGNVRTLRPGDLALAKHVAGTNPNPPHPYDDGSVVRAGSHGDLALLYATSPSDARIYAWTSGSNKLSLTANQPDTPAFALDRVGDRTAAGDFDGDGKDDIAAAMQMCDGSLRLQVWQSDGKSFSSGGGWYSGDAVDLSRTPERLVSGDFDGDGKSDLALLAAPAAGGAAIRVFKSNGAGFDDAGDWWSVASGYSADTVAGRLVAGDFNGDGRDDVAAAYQYPDGSFRFHVWLSSGNALSYSGPSGWYQSGQFSLGGVARRMLSADFNGDGRDDIAFVRNNGSSGTKIWMWQSSGSALALVSPQWSVDSGYDLGRVKNRAAAADLNADGRADIATAYQNPDGTFRFHVWLSNGPGFDYQGATGWYTSGNFNLDNAASRLVVGNWNGD